jgi:hypothetical protein
VWNLAPAHYGCNAGKNDRSPKPVELQRLVERNEAIMHSPHPLKRTLEITLGSAPWHLPATDRWRAYVRAVQDVFS